MDVESLAKQLILQNMTPEQQKAVLESVRATLQEARGKQKQRVSENVGMVVDALKKIEADIRAKYDDLGNKITTRVNSIRDGRDGANGSDGRDGLDGRPGRDGAQGPAGPAGRDGVNGIDGVDGVSVIDAKIDFDGSLIISLSNGREINVGEVVAADVAEKIRVLTYGGNSGGSGTSGLTYKGTWNASTNTPTLITSSGTNGDYYIVSVAGTTDLNGITDWQVGDWVIFNGTAWQKIDQSWATAGANNNITSMTGITGGISSPDFVQFDTGATVTNAAGRLYWDATQQTLTVGLNANIAADIGQTLYAYVTNDEAVTITKGQPVYMFAAAGDRVSVKLAYNTGDATSAKTLGVCAENIAAGQAGMVLCQGVQDGLDLSAYSPGDTLYLGATAGTLTSTKPYAPNHLVYIGVVERANAGNGRLYVRVQNGYELDELHNVSAQSPSNGQVLIYNASTSLWEKNTLTDGTGITITEGAGSITIANSGVTSLTGTANEIDVSASTGSVTLSLPTSINANLNGSVGATTPAAGTFTDLTANNSAVISVNTSGDALRITQTGTGNALVVEDSTNPDSSPFVVNASGSVGIGTSSPTVALDVVGTSGTIEISTSTTDATDKFFRFGGGHYTAAEEGVTLISGSASSGSNNVNLGGGTGVLNAATTLRLYTAADTTTTGGTERMRINSSGNVIVGSGEGTATPVGNILRAPDAVGTNIAGANLDIKPGASTGSANGGDISFYAGVTPGASGTTANSLVERMRISATTASNGPAGVVISTTGAFPATFPITSNGDRLSGLTVHGTNEQTASVGIVNWGSTSGDEPNLNFMSLNSGTVGSFGTVPVSGTNLANITFEGYSGAGSDMLTGAAIFSEASGTWTSTYAPSILRFQTATATSVLASRIVIDEDLAYIASDTGFNISEVAVTTGSSAIGNVFSGTYTPTLTNTTNIAASTAYASQYMRVGNVVTVSGRLNIDPTTSGAASELGISLPIASDITATTQCAGTGSNYTTTTEVSTGGILGDTTNNRATFRFVAGGTAARDYGFTFTYLVN